MDIENLWTEDSDVNIVKSWLCNSTDGQTYTINSRYLTKYLKPPEGKSPNTFLDFSEIEWEWDEIIGFKHDYKVDDPKLDEIAVDIDKRLKRFLEDLRKREDYSELWI